MDKFYTITENLPDFSEELELNQGNQYLYPHFRQDRIIFLPVPNSG